MAAPAMATSKPGSKTTATSTNPATKTPNPMPARGKASGLQAWLAAHKKK